MSSFLQSVRSAYGNKETLIRDAITTQLSESVKEIQLCSMDDNLSGKHIFANNFISINNHDELVQSY